MPSRPELLLSLFVKLSVFTAALLPWLGDCQDLLGPTGNSQAFPLVWLREKSSVYPFYPSVYVKVISQLERKHTPTKKYKNTEKIEVDVCKGVLNSHYFIQKRCVPSWEMF